MPFHDGYHLSHEEEDKLNQFQMITSFEEDKFDKVVKLLQDNSWNLELALSKFFDGGLETPLTPPSPAPRFVEPATELHTNLQQDMLQNELFQELIPKLPLLKPLDWRPGLPQQKKVNPVLFLLMLVPRGIILCLTWILQLFTGPPSDSQMPAAPEMESFDFQSYYEDVIGEKSDIEFATGTFDEVYNKVKQENTFMLLCLLGNNNASNLFCKKILNNDEVANAVSNMEVLVGNCNEPQFYKLGKQLRVKQLPAVYLCGNVSNGGSSVPAMSVIGRVKIHEKSMFVRHLNKFVERYEPEMILRRHEQAELHMARQLRELQDLAYEESLVQDRIKFEKIEQEKEQKKQEANEAERRERNRVNFLRKSYQEWFVHSNNTTGTLIQFRKSNGERIKHKFAESDTYQHLYLFVELQNFTNDGPYGPVDDDYEHEFTFELSCPYPKFTVPSDCTPLKDSRLWPNGSLLIEDIVEE